MYIVVDKKTNQYLSDSGTINNGNEREILQTITDGIDADKESLLYVEDSSPLVKVFNDLSNDNFKVIVEKEKIIGIKII